MCAKRKDEDVTQGAEPGVGPSPQPEGEPSVTGSFPAQERGGSTQAGENTPPAGGAAASDITFPQIARLELDDLLEQLVERAQDVMNTQGRLRGLLAATRAISSDLSLPALLLRVVQSACELVGARYGALGVLGADRELAQFITVGVDSATIEAIGPFPRGKGILGLLISDPRPLRLATLAEHPQSVGFPANHPPMKSFLGVPIRVGDQVFGNLYLTEKLHQAAFTAEDEELLSALASAAGVAIDNARLYEMEQRRQRWQRAAADISRELLAGDTDPLPMITRRAREVSEADFAAVLLQVAGADDLVVAAADGTGAGDLMGRVIPIDRSLAGKALLDGRDLIVSDARATGESYGAPGVADGPALLVRLPDTGEGMPGVLALSRVSGATGFGSEEQDMIEGFADYASVALKLAHAQDARRRLLLLEDRDRIARDLHDHVIQRLFAAGLGLTGLASRTSEPEIRQRLTQYTDQLDDTIQAIRQTIFALQRHRETGVQARVLEIARDATGALGFAPDLRFEGPLDAMIDREIVDHVTAVVRESLANAARHANATKVSATLSVVDAHNLVITIVDDGKGIGDPDHISGLGNMRSRAEQLGGSFTIESPVPPGPGGTRLVWSIPLAAGDRPAVSGR
jgi:signal transduction histidine kinase